MHFFRSLESFKKNNLHNRAIAVAIGNFDGMHIGHQSLFDKLLEHQREVESHSVVLSFRPHPALFFKRSFFKGSSSKDNSVKFPLISSFKERYNILQEFGLNSFVLERFNGDLARLSAENFIKQRLVEYIKPSLIVVGSEFRFGKDRLGDISTLDKYSKEFAYKVQALEPLTLNERKVGSGWLKEAISDGDLALIERLLGRKYSYSGKVKKGESIGSSLGFPTANLHTTNRVSIKNGVYVTRSNINGRLFNSVTNVGVRPTLDGKNLLIETHILDFEPENIYGQDLSLEFLFRMRDEMKFSGRDELIKQISIDVDKAKEYFAK